MLPPPGLFIIIAPEVASLLDPDDAVIAPPLTDPPARLRPCLQPIHQDYALSPHSSYMYIVVPLEPGNTGLAPPSQPPPESVHTYYLHRTGRTGTINSVVRKRCGPRDCSTATTAAISTDDSLGGHCLLCRRGNAPASQLPMGH
mmetsp:Transcript_37043/g.81199  ORF Transcript_37043/g.81199 Transcript_37043/m.81199 type:complete len:144 (+) Transcript_37043:1523-1954(+)